MSEKYKHPLVVLKVLEPFVGRRGKSFKILEVEDEILLKAIGIDENSPFHFVIMSYSRKGNIRNGKSGYMAKLSISPIDGTHIPSEFGSDGAHIREVDIEDVERLFSVWIGLIDKFREVKTFYDNPAIKDFKEQFYKEFRKEDEDTKVKILDEDAATSVFNYEQILYIDNYLNDVCEKLNNYKDKANPEEIEKVQKEILLLKQDLTTNTKEQVIDRLTTIMARIAVWGTIFIKDFWSVIADQSVKMTAKNIILIGLREANNLLL